MNRDLGAQTAKGLSSDTTEEVVSETLVHNVSSPQQSLINHRKKKQIETN